MLMEKIPEKERLGLAVSEMVDGPNSRTERCLFGFTCAAKSAAKPARDARYFQAHNRFAAYVIYMCGRNNLHSIALHRRTDMTSEPGIAVEIWSDYVCPFCYLELPAIERLQEEFGSRLEVTWHAFELRPDPVPTLDPDGEYLHDIWGRSVYPMAAQRGMTLRLPPVQPRSRKAFEAVAHARSVGMFDRMHAALFRGFFEQGKNIGDIDTLLGIAASVGLETAPLKEALDSGRYTQQVLDDEQQASRLGIRGVPLTLIRRADRPLAESVALSGAVPYENLHAAVVRAAE
jgi:predicted DsbA family dithiol-disulfide isomerase